MSSVRYEFKCSFCVIFLLFVSELYIWCESKVYKKNDYSEQK